MKTKRIPCDNCTGKHPSCAVCRGTGYIIKHGGKREGSGRPKLKKKDKKEPTKVVRIPISKLKNLDMGWISIKTKTPKLGITVLVTDGQEVLLGELTSMGIAIHGNNHIDVTHWMEIPDLP